VKSGFTSEYQGEKIIYAISPIGQSEYTDLGLVDLRGVKLNLVTFQTKVPGFNDLEKIYADPESGLPIRIERYVSWPLAKEYLTEEYSPKDFSLVIKKFVSNKLVDQYNFKAKAPIHNAVIFPFSFRKVKNLSIGSSFELRLPEVYKITIVSIDEIEVPAGKFSAYHFTSIPHKFEFWLSKDEYRLPLIIKGFGVFSYTLYLKKHIKPQEKERQGA
jgi:hypothetical protein